MRARNLKPAFFVNEALGECDPLARLLFAGLWCLADREGRLEDRPKRIKAAVLPYDDVDVILLLDQLEQRGFVARYDVAGQRLIEVVNFRKHQTPHPKEAPAVLPPRMVSDRETPVASREKESTSRGKVGASQERELASPSDILIPDILTPHSDRNSDVGERKSDDTGGEPTAKPARTKAANDNFDELVPSELRTDKFLDSWKVWLEYRRERKRAITPTSAKQQLRDLTSWGEAKAIEAIRTAIRCGWQGLFEPQAAANTPAPPKSAAQRDAETRRRLAEEEALA